MSFINPRDKLFKHIDRIAELNNPNVWRPPAPINVEIDLSNRCSLGCEWCHFAHTHTRGPLANKEKPKGLIPGGDLMEYGLALHMLKQLEDARVRSITWTGGGEPTLHPFFDTLIQIPTIPQGIYTHGGHINSERASLLKEMMEWVYVSLDSVSPEDYKAVKGVDRFKNACEGIEHLTAAKGKATIGVGFLVTQSNWMDVSMAVLLAKDLGADYIQFRPTILFEHTDPGKRAEESIWIDKALAKLIKLKEKKGSFVEFDPSRFAMYRDWTGHPYHTCWWSGLQTVITPNGKVWTCVNKREHPGACLGDLTEESFSEIWNKRKIARVTDSCRVMCRGHIPNLVLNQVLESNVAHPSFI